MEFFHYEYYEQVELSITMFLLQYSYILTDFSSEVAFTLFNHIYMLPNLEGRYVWSLHHF